jgi:hypothetical protein
MAFAAYCRKLPLPAAAGLYWGAAAAGLYGMARDQYWGDTGLGGLHAPA